MTANGRHNGDAVLVSHLAVGQTYAAAADAAGVSERTARRRMSEASFRRHVDAARVEIMSVAVNRAGNAALEAVETLIVLMRSADSESVRLRAARAVLELVDTRDRDPVADLIRGLTRFSGHDIYELTRQMLSTALNYIPEEKAEAFMDDAGKVLAR